MTVNLFAVQEYSGALRTLRAVIASEECGAELDAGDLRAFMAGCAITLDGLERLRN